MSTFEGGEEEEKTSVLDFPCLNAPLGFLSLSE